MTAIQTVHGDHGARFVDRWDRRVVADYGRPRVAHRAVRNGVGIIEAAADVLTVEDADPTDWADLPVVAPATHRDAAAEAVLDPGTGRFVVLPADGRIAGTASVFADDDRLLVRCAPGTGDRFATAFERAAPDVTVDRRPDLAVFGVHGPQATEKIASVAAGSPPAERLRFDRLTVGETPATVVRTDAPAGETGYEVLVAADAAADAFDTLCNRGFNAPPFGRRTWESLTLEAGTPLFEPDLHGQSVRVLGVGSNVEADPVPSGSATDHADDPRFVGLAGVDAGDTGAALAGDVRGSVTRAAVGPTVDEGIGLAVCDRTPSGSVTVNDRPVQIVHRPFVAGSERSGRLFERD